MDELVDDSGISASPVRGLVRMDLPVTSTDSVTAPELGSILAVDPNVLTPDEYQTLSPIGRRETDLSLLRSGDEVSLIKLGELEPRFEIQYPLSYSERIEFRNWQIYLDKGMLALDPDDLDTLIEAGTLDMLDAIIAGRNSDKPTYPEQASSQGFKVARFDRWRLEEQVRREREEAERQIVDGLTGQTPIESSIPGLRRAA